MRYGMLSFVPAAAVLALISGEAGAAVELVEQDTKTVGATTVTWDSSFQDLNYTAGDSITIPVTWQVDAGSASFYNFVLRNPEFTPKGPDPARGELNAINLVQDSSGAGTSGQVNVTLRFTELHCEEELDREIGNAHFSLLLNTTEGVVAYGVNLHVEDPGQCASVSGGPPDDAGGGPPPWAGGGS